MVAITESAQGGVIWTIYRKARMDDDANCGVNLSDSIMEVCIAAKAISVMGF